MFLGGPSSMAAPTSEPPATAIWRCCAACTAWAAPGGRRGSCWRSAFASRSPSPCCSACWTWAAPKWTGMLRSSWWSPGSATRRCWYGLASSSGGGRLGPRGPSSRQQRTAAADLLWSAGRMWVGCGLSCCPVPGVVGRAATQPPTQVCSVSIAGFRVRSLTPSPSRACMGLGLCMPAARVLRSWTWFTLRLAVPIRAGQVRFCLRCTALETALQGPRLGRQPSAARHGNCSRRGSNTALRRTTPRCWYVTPCHGSPRPATSRHTGHLGCQAMYGAEPMGGCIAHVVYVCWVRGCCGQGAVWGLWGGYPVHRWQRLRMKGACTAAALPPPPPYMEPICWPNAKRRTKPAKMGAEDGRMDGCMDG
ncbi:hypothetical protein PLESTF_001677900 [Pleodorina starrii]|nr:hypothetical protein PLESTF_001677900 [Pleodorina starrii]